MDERRNDFRDDLHQLQEDIKVDDILDALQQQKQASQSSASLQESTKTSRGRKAKTTHVAALPVRAKSEAPTPRAGLQNVTTRLTPETNEILRRAALQQQLKKHSPSTRQEIIEESIREWAHRRGYLRDSKSSPAEDEPNKDVDINDGVTP